MIQQVYSVSLKKQVKIVTTSMALHNFISNHSMRDKEFKPYDNDEELLPQLAVGGSGIKER